MSPCSSAGRFAIGWLTGGNRDRFAALARSGHPMGVLASIAREPVGWGACGPRSRYRASPAGRILSGRDRAEDDRVWLVACVFVAEAWRGRGIGEAVVDASVDLAAGAGAIAIEAWPSTSNDPTSSAAFQGREQVFAQAGFRPIDWPAPGRVLMRLDLRSA